MTDSAKRSWQDVADSGNIRSLNRVIIRELTLQMQNILIYLIAGVVLLLSGCEIHRPDVQQGNVLDPQALAQLHTGLSKKQVKFLMGTPVISDAFNPDRWDYVYWLKSEDKPLVKQRVTVFFDKDMVSRLETEGITLPAPAAAPSKENTPPTTEGKDKPGQGSGTP